jgi:hypothetical protein
MVVYRSSPLKAFSFNKLWERKKFAERKEEKWVKNKETR